MKTFLVPKEPILVPAFGPKALIDLGINPIRSVDAGDFYMVRVEQPDDILDQLRARAGVVEINEGQPLTNGDKQAVAAMAGKLSVNIDVGNGDELIAEIRHAAMANQVFNSLKPDEREAVILKLQNQAVVAPPIGGVAK